MARGDAHEAMNLAGVRGLPIVFICDNNQWAYSTPTHLEYAVEHLADRAAAYGFEGVVVDGTDVLAVYREAKAAIEKAREGGGPTLLELKTLRMEGPRGPRRRVLRPQGAVRGVGEERSARALPHLAARQRRVHRRGRGRAREPRQEDPERRAREGRRVAGARPGHAARGRLRDPGRPRHARTTSSRGREDLPPGDQRRAPAGDAARRARLRARRGRRRLRRRLQGDARLPGGVRPLARDRHAARGDRDPRRRHRLVDHGHAAGRRDAVRRLHLLRLGPPRHRRRQAALPRRHAGADRRPAPFRRRLLRRPVPFAEPGELVRAHPRPQVRLPGHAGGREGPARRGDRGSEPRPLLRAQAPVPPDQGRSAGRALRDADREGAHAPRGRRHLA